jgi:tetratricopeptide (TPR) repeat protein
MAALIGRGIVLQRQGRLAEAEAVYRAVLSQSPDDADALHYMGLVNFQAGKLEDAAAFMSRSLEIDRLSANTWNDLGAVKLKIGQLDESVQHFARALELKPNHTDALRNIAAAFRRLYRFESAVKPLRQLSRLRPRSAEILRTLADTLYHTGAVAESIELHHRALHLNPDNKAARLGIAEACESSGKFKQARWHYSVVLRRDPHNALALSKLLQLREGTIESDWVAKAQRLAEQNGTDADTKSRLDIGLAFHFDRVGAYDCAFRHLEQARNHQARLRPFNSDGYSAAVDTLIGVFAKGAVWPSRERDAATARPIFIVGMPRSGTTLTEQVLASHPGVAAGGELAALPSASYRVQELSSDHRPYPYGLKTISTAALRELARGYLGQLDKIDTAGRMVTDKLPFNFMHLGIIALMFPGAKVVHCRRDPLDNCTSCYFTSFAEEVAFAADLGTLGRYYADYHRLMAHWCEVLPITMLELKYEDLVSDTEAAIRRLLGYCELDWEPACLKFHETQREIRTPSRWQVRQPIYGNSVARWRRYEKYLEPLKLALGPVLAAGDPVRDSSPRERK